MAGKDILKQAGQSITGNVESAYFIIYDFRNMTDTLFGQFQGGGSVGTGVRTSQNDAAAKLAFQSFKENIKSDNSLLNSAKSLKSITTPGGNSKIYRLQFNPSSIQVYASALSVSQPDAGDKTTAVSSPQAPGLTMSASFWFDEATTWDCFPGDKFDGGLTNPTSLIKNAVAIGEQSGKKGKPTSVRPTVEAFLAALRNPFTRNLTFRWADFVFTGELLSVGSAYTMFSSQGEPVRAQMSMRIQQKIYQDILKPWLDTYDEVIGTQSASGISLGEGAFMNSYSGKRDAVGSIFNVSR